ncbi:hypothetical protein OC835_007020 [Tilletia horrida]|nr:hypothetical protein OC835_007020 [Tilletia horrida]
MASTSSAVQASSSSSSSSDTAPRSQAFYLGPRGTYSHGVARAVFHATRPSAPPTPGVPSVAPSSSSSAAAQVQLVPCATISRTLDAALGAVRRAETDDQRNSAVPAKGHGDGGRAAYAVLPIENSTFGPVRETLDALQRAGISIAPAGDTAPAPDSDSVPFIVGEYRLAVSHTLLAGPGTKRRLRDLARGSVKAPPQEDGHGTNGGPHLTQAAPPAISISTSSLGDGRGEPDLELDELAPLGEILSHEQALGQCSIFMKTYAPRARRTPVSSTALASEEALHRDYGVPLPPAGSSGSNGHTQVRPNDADANDADTSRSPSLPSSHPAALVAAIGSELCAEIYGLSILCRHIEDRKDNTTRFIVVRVDAPPTAGRRPPADEDSPELSALRPFEGVPVYGNRG